MGFWSAPFLASGTGGLGLTPRATAEVEAASRFPFVIVEIDLPGCANTYADGVTCTATDRGDGGRCYYSRHTCQKTADYEESTKTFRFISNAVRPDRAPEVFNGYSQLWPILVKSEPVAQEIETTGGFQLPGAQVLRLVELGTEDLVESA